MMDRRSFMHGLSAAAIAISANAQSLTGADAEAARQIAPSHDATPLRLGIIGPGSRGKELARSFLRVPGVRITAAADVYAPRFAELNQVCGYEVASHADYRALLDRKDVDAVIVATPLGLHGEQVLAALQAEKHVYGEKTMAFTLDQSAKIVQAATATPRIFQIGHQYRYSPWIRAALARVHQGEIGDVTHIIGYWHRNNSWRRPVPQPSLERLINWRLYNQWSLGLLAELGSHHMDIANWTFGATPTAALASGSICTYHDGRETDDNVQAVLSYPGGKRFIFSSVTDNSQLGDQLWLYGTKGSLNLTLQDATFYYEPRQVTRVDPNHNGAAVTSASYQASGEMPYRGPGHSVEVTTAEDPTTAATRAFIYCCRTGTHPIADVHVGYGSALCVIQSNQARLDRREVAVPPAL